MLRRPPRPNRTAPLLPYTTVFRSLCFDRGAVVERMNNPGQMFDALGLGLFAVTGATKALAAGLGPVGALLLGMLTGIGGGIARDVLAMRVPVVLQSDLYAVAALAGAAVVVIAHRFGVSGEAILLAGAGLVVFLRFMAIRHGGACPSGGRGTH